MSSDITAGGGGISQTDADARYLALAGGTLTGALLLPSGSAGAPALAGAGDSDTGITFDGSNVLGLVAGGTEAVTIQNNALTLGSGVNLKLGTSSIVTKTVGGVPSSYDATIVGPRLKANYGDGLASLDFDLSGISAPGSATVTIPAGGGTMATVGGNIGAASATSLAQSGTRKRVSTQFDATTTTLGNVTGLSVTLTSGRSYAFRAVLHIAADAVGGHKYAIGGTCTATAIIYQVNSINNGTNAFRINSRQTALGGSVGEAVGTAYFTTIEGEITVNAGGTLTVQFAQNAANGTSSVLVGSTLIIEDVA